MSSGSFTVMAKRKKRRPAARLSSSQFTACACRRSVAHENGASRYTAPGLRRKVFPLVTAPDDLKKDIATIERMRLAGSAARRVLRKVANEISPGVTTDYLDQVCHQACIEEGGYPSPLNYNGYPKSLCTSINEIICHGIPDDRPLRGGRHYQLRRNNLSRWSSR